MLTPDDISTLRRLMELRAQRDEKELAAKEAKAAYQDAEADLYETLSEGPVDRLSNVDLGEPWGKVSFRKRETYYGRIIPGEEEKALAYYEQRAMVDEVSAPKFVMKRINEEVRDCIEQGRNPPPGIDWYANRGVTITRQKS
jgi:hypothetical protein